MHLLTVDLHPDWSISLQLSLVATAVILVGVALYVIWRWLDGRSSWTNFEVDRAEVGIGTGKITLRPNITDRQVAYSIWVELSTRKIGLPVDFEHDVVAEIYDSWHTFFSVTRELIKSVPVNKVRQSSTQQIIQLSIEILNEGLRPHLTMWQARFRRWYENEMQASGSGVAIAPQDVQKKFPRWEELKSDMEKVNQHLIAYRKKMHALVYGARE